MSLSIKNSCGGKSLPELTNPATASDIASGKQAIDGAGNIIDGNLDEITTGYTFQASIDGSFGSYIYSRATLGTDMIFRNGSNNAHEISASEFGDATAADVAAGKTFTSAMGLKVKGTGAICETGTASTNYSNRFNLTIPNFSNYVYCVVLCANQNIHSSYITVAYKSPTYNFLRNGTELKDGNGITINDTGIQSNYTSHPFMEDAVYNYILWN